MPEVGPHGARTQGAYFARRCPEAVRLEVIRPCEPLPPSEFYRSLAQAGTAFENAVVGELLSHTPGAVLVERALDRAARERATAEDDPGARSRPRQWLLSYNEDDVRATLAVRDWLERVGPSLGTVEDDGWVLASRNCGET